jgi:hypothetical protein
LDIIWKDHRFITHGAARLLHFSYRPLAHLFARPEREARSVRTVEDIPALDPGRDLDLLPSPVAECGRHDHASWLTPAFDLRVPAVAAGQPRPKAGGEPRFARLTGKLTAWPAPSGWHGNHIGPRPGSSVRW